MKSVRDALIAPPGSEGDAIRIGLAAIDRVHDDGALPTISVERIVLAGGMQGGYGDDPPYRLVVGLNSLHPAFAFAHEVGHLLDHHGLGNGLAFASEGDPRLADWRAAVRSSRVCRVLSALAKSTSLPIDVTSHAEYLQRDIELWARTYQQFVTLRSGDPDLQHALDSRRLRPAAGKLYIPSYWDDVDFADIASEIERLFRRLGWMT